MEYHYTLSEPGDGRLPETRDNIDAVEQYPTSIDHASVDDYYASSNFEPLNSNAASACDDGMEDIDGLDAADDEDSPDTARADDASIRDKDNNSDGDGSSYGELTENDEYNLNELTDTEENINDLDNTEDSKIPNTKTSRKINQDSVDIKEEFDPEMKVIVLNKHNKFNARRKPDASVLRHECDKCDDAFRFPYQLFRHQKIKHEGKYPYHCEVCSKPFDRSSSLRDHYYVHTDSRPCECQLCDRTFKMKGNLRKHMRDVHSDDADKPKLKFQCEYCSKIFPTKERLTSHFIVHETEKAFACQVCGKRFHRKNNLKEHVVIHSTEKNFKCPDCGMCFNRKYSLKIHARNHMAVKPYKCELCPSSFSQLHALKTHFRLHTGEKPFKCSICEKTFRQLATLQVHFKRHTGVKDFKCGICGKAFVIKRRLIEHERLHTGEKPFSCNLCTYRAATSSGLRLHQKTHIRQMERLARQGADQPTNNTGGGSKKGKPMRNGKSSVSRNISTKVYTNDNESVSNGTEEEENNSFDDDNEEFVRPEGSKETVTGACGIPINNNNENLIEIVNDIADAEVCTKDTNADTENVYIDEDERSVDIRNETKETEKNESQVCGTESSSKSGKKASRVGGRKKKVQGDEFESLAKEVLYKHLNEFIPSIDADILTEKIDLIAKELSETRGQQNTGVQKAISVKAKKTKKIFGKEEKNDSTSDNISGDVDYINGSEKMKDSVGTKRTSDSSAVIHAIPEYGTHKPILAKKTSKSTKPRIVKNASASVSSMHSPSSNNRELKQMLSSTTSSIATSNRPNLFSLYKPPVQESVHMDKPFLSAALRNMLSPPGPNSASNQIATMACPPTVPMATTVKKENHSSNSSSVGSSTVLRNMLSTPPKHYLISTKNSYAALQYAKKRQTTQSSSQNGFPGVWHVPGQVGGASDFPWVDEDVAPPVNSVPSVSNALPSVYDTIPSVGRVKIEPVSP